MFHNQAVAAQNVSRMYGVGPIGGQQAQPMPNPYPAEPAPSYALNRSFDQTSDTGMRVVGGMGMALPAAATAVSLGGAFMGGAPGLADPFTGVARAFRAGSGAAKGAGFGATMGHVGTAFRTGGVRAGMGVLGGGLAAGAAAAVPYWLAGQAISTVGETIYSGAQDVQQVGQMAQQHMGPAWGQVGGRRGGMRGRGQIRGMVNVLREMAGDDVMQDMESLKRLMDQAGQSGMLSGVQDVKQFRSKFRKIVDRTKVVAKALGTSLEEAMPLMSQMGKMGLWTARDIMGTTTATRAAGTAGTPHMMNTMQTAAQQSVQMGGSARTGALMGRELFRTMQAATRSGAISREQMFEFTGGATGEEGNRVAAQRTMGIMQRFGKTSMGRLMLAGLGETEENEEGQQVFTGRVDSKRLAQFQRGEISVRQLQKRGQQATQGSREGAASFMIQQERLGQEMLSQGGVEGMNEALQRVLEHAMPNAGENVRKRLSQVILGVSARDVEMISKLADEQESIKDQKLREEERVIDETMRRMEERQFRSWDGLKDVAKQAWDDTLDPLRSWASDMATGIAETKDRVIDKIYGRTRTIAMGGQERLRLFRQGMRQEQDRAITAAGAGPAGAGPGEAGTAAGGAGGGDFIRMVTAEEAGAAPVNQGWFTPGAQERFVAGSIMGGAAGEGAGFGLAGRITGGLAAMGGGYQGSRAQAVEALGVRPVRRVREGDLGKVDREGMVAGPAQDGMVALYSTKDIRQKMERAQKRAAAPTLRNLLGKGADTDENKAHVAKIQAAMRAIRLDPKKSARLKKLQDSGQPERYNSELAHMLTEEAGQDVAEAFGALGYDMMGDAGSQDVVRDIIKIAAEEGEGVNLGLEEESPLKALGRMSAEEAGEVQEDNIRRMQEVLSGEGMDTGTAAELSGVPLIGPALSVGYMAMTGAQGTVEDAGLTDDELKSALGDYGGDISEVAKLASEGKLNYDELKKLMEKGNKFAIAASSGEETDPAARLMGWLQRSPTSAVQAFMGGVGKDAGGLNEFLGVRMYRATEESLDRVRKVARGQGEISEAISEPVRERLKGIQKSMANVKDMPQYSAIMGDVEALAEDLDPEDIQALSKGEGGTFGRQAAAIARTGEMRAMSGEEFAGLRKRISASMRVKDVDKFLSVESQKELEQALSDDDISAEEAASLQAKFKEDIKTAMTAEGKEAINKDLMAQLDAYTQANTAFVQVVGDALSKMSGLDKDAVRDSMSRMTVNNLKNKEED